MPHELFRGDDAMRQAFRDQDWSACALGSVDDWSPSLRSTVEHILWSDFPNLVLWGPSLVQLYNEPYRKLLGSAAPHGFCQPAREAAPEAWSVDGPIYERVFAGETISREHALAADTADGHGTKRYTVSYQPIFSAPSKVDGILVTLFVAHERRAVPRTESAHPRSLSGPLSAPQLDASA